MTAELDLEVLLGTISRLLAEDVGHRLASIVLWDAEEGVLRRHAMVFADGTSAPNSPGVMLHDDAPAMKTFRTRKTQVYRWRDVEALGEPAIALMRQMGLRSLCCVPLQTPRDCHGVLMVGRPDDVPYSAADVALLEQVAQPLAIAIENALAYRRISDLRDRLADEKVYLEDEVTRNHEFDEIVGQSRALAAVLHQVRTVAPTDATVLLLGETGTGKELVARAIHESSRRHARSFIRINSAALPAALVESELFGYERGAFTGAVASKAGRLELAHQGTLFLDEVGELPLDVQPKLLRAIQEREFERLGGTAVRRVDVRLIAATNRDLEAMVAEGVFRSDLYYRLSVFPIRVPPLRERPEDIPFLVRHFVDVFSRRDATATITTIPAKTFAALQRWHWPGNIRELQNVIERAVILSRGSTLEVPDSTFQEKAAPQPRGRRRHAGALCRRRARDHPAARCAPPVASSAVRRAPRRAWDSVEPRCSRRCGGSGSCGRRSSRTTPGSTHGLFGTLHRLPQGLASHRFRHVVDRAKPANLLDDIDLADGRCRDEHGPRPLLSDLLHQPESVVTGHPDVTEHDRGRMLRHQPEGVIGGTRRPDRKSPLLQPAPQQVTHPFVVVDHEHRAPGIGSVSIRHASSRTEPPAAGHGTSCLFAAATRPRSSLPHPARSRRPSPGRSRRRAVPPSS